MKKTQIACFVLILIFVIGITGCKNIREDEQGAAGTGDPISSETREADEAMVLTEEIVLLEDGFSAVRYDGDYGFENFLSRGGASSDGAVVEYLENNLLSGLDLGDLLGGVFGCSTISVQTAGGNALFGRNFDWQNCEAMVVEAHPENRYASVSTVNMDFITRSTGGGMVGMAMRLDEVKTLAALYAPLDGMNEMGLAVSVNMIQDSAAIEQNTERPDLTTTTAIRLLLDWAADVEEALDLLSQYDMHGSMDMMIHFAIADQSGRSVAVEYVAGEMIVTDTPVLTNFYLAEGDKQGIGTQQSHERYEILMERLKEQPDMTMEDVRDALDSVSKDNFGEFESTEWSAVFNQTTGEVRYYHRENYRQPYLFKLEK